MGLSPRLTAASARILAWAEQPADPRVLAIFRVSVAGVMLFDLADRLRDAFAFYSDLGIVSRADVVAVTGRFAPGGLFQLAGSPAGVAALLALGFVVGAALLLGYRTRLANLLCWIFVLSIQDRDLAITDGGDTVLRMLLFWGLWCDLGAGYSLDARRGTPASSRAGARGLGLRCVQIQLAIIYLVSSLSKTGASWRNGTAIYYALTGTGFTRPSGMWLVSRPALTVALTFATLAIEFALPALILSPFRPRACRAVAIGLALALHLGIAMAMRVGIFPLVMLAGFTALIQPAWLDRWSRRSEVRPRPSTGVAASTWPLALRVAPPLIVAVILATIMVEQGSRVSRRPMPTSLTRLLNPIEAHQNWAMFAPEPTHASGGFQLPGLLADGSSVDLVARAAPGLGPHSGWGYSRWEKLSLALREPGNSYLVPFGRFICRRYNGDTAGPRLVSFKMVLVLRATPAPGAAATDKTDRITYLEQSCGATPALTASAGTADSSR